MKPYDNVEVAGIFLHTDNKGKQYPDRITDPTIKPGFWSVYLHRSGEGCECIADVYDKETAKLIADYLWHGIPYYKRKHKLIDETF